MSIIEKGLDPADYKELYKHSMWRINPLSNLKWGLVACFVGAGILIGMWINDFYQVRDHYAPALALIAGGLALVLFYFIAAKKTRDVGPSP